MNRHRANNPLNTGNNNIAVAMMSSRDNKMKRIQSARASRSSSFLRLFSIALWVGQATLAAAFVPTTLTPGSKQIDFASRSIGTGGRSELLEPSCFASCRRTHSNSRNRKQSTELYFMGSDGGFLGIGTPELFTIILIGYFVLGASDLYKLVKEVGKFVQNFQNFATEATASLENNMESQLALEDIRKTQQELTDAFSFRRSINVEAESDPFEVNVQSPRLQDSVVTPAIDELEYDLSTTATAATATAGAAVAPKKKKMRRVKRKKKVAVDPTVASEGPEVPVEAAKTNDTFDMATANQQLVNDIPAELNLDDEFFKAENQAMESILNGGGDDLKIEEKETSNIAAQIREERIERLERGQLQQSENDDDTSSLVEQSRFEQQMSGNWNSQIVANSDKLEPLAGVMDRLAVLEEEKIAADKRLQEEFKAREENEETFYREKRKLLEEAAAEIQASAYASNMPTASSSTMSESGSKK